MHLFLQGPMGIGKSTLLREALIPAASVLAGFATQRLVENGKTIGYRAVSADGPLCPVETPYSEGIGGVFLLRGNRDVSVLEQIIEQAEQDMQKEHVKLLILDEIGGIELTSQRFMASLMRILSGKKPCAGVFKSAGNLAHTSSVLGLEQSYPSLHGGLEQHILLNGRILTLTNENRQKVQYCLQEFIKAVLKN